MCYTLQVEIFSDGEFLHADIKYAAQFISCTPIKLDNIIHIKCALGFYGEIPKYIIPD